MKKMIRMGICMAAVLLCVLSCGKTPAGDKTTGDLTTPVDVETAVTEPEVPPLHVIADGKTEYVLVRPEAASAEVIAAAMTLHQAINETYGIKMTLTTDFEKRGYDISQRYPYEIVVGNTNREESEAAREIIRYNDALIAVKGTRVVITGGSDEAVTRAVEHFIATYLTADELRLAQTQEDILPATYLKEEVRLDGAGISEYTIVYSTAYRKAAQELAHRIGMGCGAWMRVISDKEARSGREIVLGSESRGVKNTGMVYDSFAVAANGEDLWISGGAVSSVETACAKLLEKLLEGDKTDYAPSETALTYTLPDRQEYIADIGKLALNWELYFDTPDWMLDYDEKYAAMLNANGRLMSCLHRGDMQMYPENSIEGLISAVRMGADMVEIDPRRTKDGVLVLLHDATLTRTTDFKAKAGKNGLPTSANVADWTYEQLMQLNLKQGAGGDSARVTEYKIPTLDEAFRVCANRIFIRLDVKEDASGKIFWDYERDIWPLMVKYGSYTNVIYTWHSFVTADNYALVRKFNAEQIKACGAHAMHFIKASGSAQSIINLIRSNPSLFTPTVRLTDFDLKNYSYKTYLSKQSAKLSGLKGRIRMYVDAHSTNSQYPENKEGAEMYAALNGAGINVLLVNRGYDLCTYIAKNFEATRK